MNFRSTMNIFSITMFHEYLIFKDVSCNIWDTLILKKHFLFIWYSNLSGCWLFYQATLALPIISIRDKASEICKGDEPFYIISGSSVLTEWKTAIVWCDVLGDHCWETANCTHSFKLNLKNKFSSEKQNG